MSNTNTPSVPEPIEMLSEWEGPAIINPAVFAGPKELEAFLADANRIDEAAVWVTVHSGPSIVDSGPAPRRRTRSSPSWRTGGSVTARQSSTS